MFTYIDGKFQELKDLDTLFSQIKFHVSQLEEANRRFSAENEYLKSEAYASEELSKMKKELDEARANYARGFSISAQEQASIAAWKNHHVKECHPHGLHPTAIGGNWQYEFIPTSIGNVGTIYCYSCKRKAEEEFYSYPYRSRTSDLKNKIFKKYNVKYTFKELE